MFQIVLCLMYNLSWKFQENLLTRFSIIVLTIMDSQNRKIDPEFKGLITTTRKCFRLFFVSCTIFSWKFHENPFIRFPEMLLTGTDFLEKKRRYNKPASWSYILLCSSVLFIEGVKHNTHKIFQIVPWILLNLYWKFHGNPFMHFPVMLFP